MDPTKTVKVNGKPQICDISRLANRLNSVFEKSLKNTDNSEEEKENKPNAKTSPKKSKKKLLVKQLKKLGVTADVNMSERKLRELLYKAQDESSSEEEGEVEQE